MTTKRERCMNWEQEEKQLLRDIIKPYLSIIENKNLCTNTNKSKASAWNKIIEKFNVANIRPRDKKQIINQWKLIKLIAKKQVSLHRLEMTKTGGGPKPPSPSPDALEVVEMIPQEFEIGFNEFDCDGIQNDTKHINPILVEIQNDLGDNIENKNVQLNAVEGIDLSIDQGSMHKTPLTTTTPKRSAKKTLVINDKFNFAEKSYQDMHSFRELENQRKQCEHDLRMKNMKDFHSKVMENVKLQNEILLKTLEDFNKN